MSFLLTELPSLCMLHCRCEMSGMLLSQYLLEEVIKTTWLLVDPQARPRQSETLYPHSAHHSHIVVQSLSRVWLFVTPWTSAHQAFLSFTISQSLLRLLSIQSVMPYNHLILCHPLPLPPSNFPSIRVFSNESALRIRCPQHWNFSISSSNEYSGLISFRTDWFDLLAVQGTLKSLLQHHSSKASILWHSAFFMVQLTSVHDWWKNDSFDCMDLCW